MSCNPLATCVLTLEETIGASPPLFLSFLYFFPGSIFTFQSLILLIISPPAKSWRADGGSRGDRQADLR